MVKRSLGEQSQSQIVIDTRNKKCFGPRGNFFDIRSINFGQHFGSSANCCKYLKACYEMWMDKMFPQFRENLFQLHEQSRPKPNPTCLFSPGFALSIKLTSWLSWFNEPVTSGLRLVCVLMNHKSKILLFLIACFSMATPSTCAPFYFCVLSSQLRFGERKQT